MTTAQPKTQPIVAIPTTWNGIEFRSRLEARWAIFFEIMHIQWEYEPERFQLSDGSIYVPDFRLLVHVVATEPCVSVFAEVKPDGDPFIKALDLARSQDVMLLEGPPPGRRDGWKCYLPNTIRVATRHACSARFGAYAANQPSVEEIKKRGRVFATVVEFLSDGREVSDPDTLTWLCDHVRTRDDLDALDYHMIHHNSNQCNVCFYGVRNFECVCGHGNCAYVDAFRRVKKNRCQECLWEESR